MLPKLEIYVFYNGREKYEKTINECIDKGILADYLRIHGSEVVNMLMSQYNYEMDIEVQREEAFGEGQRVSQKRFAMLTAKLVEVGRSEDVIKAAQDMEFCEKLYREYHIQQLAYEILEQDIEVLDYIVKQPEFFCIIKKKRTERNKVYIKKDMLLVTLGRAVF